MFSASRDIERIFSEANDNPYSVTSKVKERGKSNRINGQTLRRMDATLNWQIRDRANKQIAITRGESYIDERERRDITRLNKS